MTPNAHIANMPAFPFGKDEHPGMTYREYLVAQIAPVVYPLSFSRGQRARQAIQLADDIIAELAKDK